MYEVKFSNIDLWLYAIRRFTAEGFFFNAEQRSREEFVIQLTGSH
mgnify:CR=1 FL=1